MAPPLADLQLNFDLWQVRHDALPLELLFLSFIASFVFIRISARLMRSPRVPWWPGSVVSEGGLHVHHLVFGIVLMMAGGVLGYVAVGSPWEELCAVAFGIGAGLTIDEFALWLHLDDVYWSDEGRTSIDAAVIATVAMGAVLLGMRPFDLEGGSVSAVVLSVVAVLSALVPVFVCFAKQRIMHGAVGFFLWPFALWGAFRLGKPRSPWARRFYGERNPSKQARSEERFRPDRRTERLKQAFRDVIGGTPTEIYEAKLAGRAAEHQPELAARDDERQP